MILQERVVGGYTGGGIRTAPMLRFVSRRCAPHAYMRGVGHGNLCKLRHTEDGSWSYGRELPLAVLLNEHEIRLVKGMRAQLEAVGGEAWQGRNFPAGGRLGRAVFEERVLPLVPALSGGGALAAVIERSGVLTAQVDYRGLPAKARRDSHGLALQSPTERRNYPACCQHCPQLPVCETSDPAMTPALAWRKLGLIEPDGTPTLRGTIFGFFNHGEGLAIAAALEQPEKDYPIEALIYDLANLRAGHRFAAEGDNPYGGGWVRCARGSTAGRIIPVTWKWVCRLITATARRKSSANCSSTRRHARGCSLTICGSAIWSAP